MTSLSRRDVLKLMGLGAASLAARPFVSMLDRRADASTPHVFIFVFDAWSGAHLKMNGYRRDTMPNLDRFAERCVVYHRHYSAGSFTVPGTASLLTGLHPWSHRAIQLTAGGVLPEHQAHNVFTALRGTHESVAYAQNPYADIFLYQFRDQLREHVPQHLFDVQNGLLSNLPIFRNDAQMAFASFENNIIRDGKGTSGSLYLGMISRLSALKRFANLRSRYIKEYPAGLPLAGGYFFLDQLVDGLVGIIDSLTSPSIAYLHVFPPHEPYAPRRDFAGMFDDDWPGPEKPFHPLSRARHPLDEMAYNRRRYDQYLAAWDAEFAHALEYLESSGMLEKSIVIITSDHGELFERGELGHNTMVLPSPVVHVPLFVSLPGQATRTDIHAFTSSVDVLPTIAHLVGAPVPNWTEGSLLPGLGGTEDPSRAIFSMDAKSDSTFGALMQYSTSITRDGQRLIYYNYPNYNSFELYDLLEDPEELRDLYKDSFPAARRMKDELLQKIEDVNRRFRK